MGAIDDPTSDPADHPDELPTIFINSGVSSGKKAPPLDKIDIGGEVRKGVRINPYDSLATQVVKALNRNNIGELKEPVFFESQEDRVLDVDQLYNDISMLTDLYNAERNRLFFAMEAKAQRERHRDQLLGVERTEQPTIAFGFNGTELMSMKRFLLDAYRPTLQQLQEGELKAGIEIMRPTQPRYSSFNVQDIEPDERERLSFFVAHEVRQLEGFIGLKTVKFAFIKKVLDFCNAQYARLISGR
jgi:hypothetical protein